MMTTLTYLYFGGMFFLAGVILLWLIIRIALFLEPYLEYLNLPIDTIRIASFLQRIILIAVAGILLFLVFPTFAIQVFIGRAFHPNSGDIPAFILLGSLSLYFLSAVIINFPGFPIALHKKLFWPVHLLLLPCIVSLIYPLSFAVLFICVGVYTLLWRWNLKERST
jgi:hypothetical protein